MKALKTGLILLLISFVLVGSTGLTVFNHLCNSTGYSSTSVFIQQANCEDEHEVKSCCTDEKNQSDEDDCCSDETTVYKVKFDFFQSEKNAISAFVIPSFHHHFVIDVNEKVLEIPQRKISFEDPDPPSGRDILLYHSVLRI